MVETIDDGTNPEYPDPFPTESQVIAAVAQTAYERQVVMASTPDPDAPPCEFCRGGKAHYPECPTVVGRSMTAMERQDLADEIEMDML